MAESRALRQFLARIGPAAAAGFTADQLAAIELHFGMRYRVGHTVDWRKRVRLPFARFYVVVLAGREQRGGV